MNRRHRTAAAWIAIFAMLVATLLPTLARAGAAEGGSWVEICTTGTPQPGSVPAMVHLDHCPYCTLQGGGWAPPPPAPQALAPLAAPRPALQAPRAVPPAQRPHSTAAPRGPPAQA